jgi:hypothetical protein
MTKLLIYYSTIRLKIRLIFHAQIQQPTSFPPVMTRRAYFNVGRILEEGKGSPCRTTKEISIISTLRNHF